MKVTPNRFVAETDKDTQKRLNENYVTERERRFFREIADRLVQGLPVTQAQHDRAANIRTALVRRKEIA